MQNEDWFIDRIDDRTIKTVFGTAKIQKSGYYVITSRMEGNNKKPLHLLIWEKVFGKRPKGYHVHHKDFDKINNSLDNLVLLSSTEHKKIHTSGENNPMYRVRGSDHPMHGRDRSKEKNPFYQKKHNEESLIQMSSKKNNTGIFRISKRACKKCKRGFIYGYRWKDGNKTRQISSSFLYDLKEKMDKKKFDWIIIDLELFNETKEEEMLIDERAKFL